MGFPQNIQPSLRIYLRKQIKVLLKKYVDIGQHVFACRPHPLLLEHLPCVAFYPMEEAAEHRNTSPRIYTREYSLIVEVLHAEPIKIDDAETIEDFLDCRIFEVEYALLHDIALELGEKGNWIQDITLVNTVPSRQVYEDVMNVSAIKSIYNIVYNSEIFEVDALDEFKKFTNKMLIGDDEEEVDDSVTIRE
jgi:hypothetical protein